MYFWVVGDSSINSVLITDFLTTNKYHGDHLRRVFPLSPYDYSIELTVNRTTHERVYSCVIDGATDLETTLFTYIVHTIDLEEISNKTLNGVYKEEKIAAHDTLNKGQIHSLRKNLKISSEEGNVSEEDTHDVARVEEEDEEEDEHTTTI